MDATGQASAGSQSHDPEFPERFREFMRAGWRDAPLEVSPRVEAPDHAKRRAELSHAFPGETLVIPAGVERVRSNDTYHRFRPGTEHVWLTGEHGPESVLVLRPTEGGHDATLYVRPRSPRDTDEFFTDRNHGELWIGRRATLPERALELQVQTAHLDELAAALDDAAPGRTRVLRGYDPAVDERVRATAPERDQELARVLSELRLVKDAWELEQLQDAIDVTVRGFEDAARALPADRPVSERLVEGVFGLRARHDGNDVGYGSIVGAGAHAAILHWTRNDGTTRPGELLLMDMGVENRNLYTADVTRTVPVSGTFTPLQREVYDLVFRSQQAGIDAIRPGVAFDDVHQACMRVLAEGLIGLGVLKAGLEEALDPESILYRRWTLHGFGHMLGLDVHDCAHARKERYREGHLDAGYVLTVEPGLYFQPEDDLVPTELHGLAVRIEDDVLVTPTGARNLSDGLPRSADDVESWLAARRAEPYQLP
ncbi:aminopeptidase P family protein [Dactylosporangium sp. CA-139066]|uniref:aminopeptidase P family protein n=1 Tax=Dactylosporangium sp. CA-139066 TaxID=3239930 RepID=UPI003D8F3E0A